MEKSTLTNWEKKKSVHTGVWTRVVGHRRHVVRLEYAVVRVVLSVAVLRGIRRHPRTTTPPHNMHTTATGQIGFAASWGGGTPEQRELRERWVQKSDSETRRNRTWRAWVLVQQNVHANAYFSLELTIKSLTKICCAQTTHAATLTLIFNARGASARDLNAQNAKRVAWSYSIYKLLRSRFQTTGHTLYDIYTNTESYRTESWNAGSTISTHIEPRGNRNDCVLWVSILLSICLRAIECVLPNVPTL